MKAKRTPVAAVLICAVYIITLITSISILSREYIKGPETTSRRFESIKSSLSRSIKPFSATFADQLIEAVGSLEDIKLLQVKYDGETVLAYPMDSSEGSQSALVASYTTTLTAETGKSVVLSASLYLLKPSSIYKVCRIAFLVLLAATLIALFVLIHSERSASEEDETEEVSSQDKADAPNEETKQDAVTEQAGNEQGQGEEASQEEKTEDTEAPSPSDKGEAQETPAAEEMTEQDSQAEEQAPAEPQAEDVQQKEEEPEQNQESESAKDETPADEQPSETAEESVPAQSGTEAQDDKPRGLFNPATNYGWEEYMIPRLDRELIRAASAQQELALVKLELDTDWSTREGSVLNKCILETIKFNDLIFDSESNGCYIIVQESDVDAAIEVAEKLLDALRAAIAESGIENAPRICIGITSRSYRLITGKRLLNEVNQALIHAKEDKDSPIVAFRVNPEKYRDYLAAAASKRH